MYNISLKQFIYLTLCNISDPSLACYAIRIRGSEYPPEMYQDIIRSHQARYDEGEGGEAVYEDD